jgi:putative ABC transport system permease protein
VQSALGANRGRLVRQMLLEGLVVSMAGSALAVVIASLTRAGIVALSANQIPRVDEIAIGFRTILFAAGAGILTTLLVSLGPAIVLTGGSHTDRLQRGSRSTTASGAGRRWFGPLIAVEFALAVLLASAAGLLVTSYRHLSAVDSGFRPAQVISAKLAVPLTREWSGDEPNRQLNAALLANLLAQPGVQHAAVVSRLPLSDVRGGTDLWPSEDEARKTPALLQLTSEGYFAAMGSRVVAGRDFEATDTVSTPAVAIVNDVLARRLWPDSSAVGRRVTYQFMRGPVTAEIVGVVPAIRYNDLKTDVRPEIYVTFRQALNTPLTVVAKTSLDPVSAAAALRTALSRTDPTHSVTFTDVTTLDAQLSRVLAQPRFYLVMVGVFASVAFLLAALGIYGTMMFWVGERWREFGIRIALGANRASITSLLLRHGLGFAGAGMVLGLGALVAGRRLLASLLFQVAPADPLVLGGAIALLAVAALVAAALPARRVARVDPVTTLRSE